MTSQTPPIDPPQIQPSVSRRSPWRAVARSAFVVWIALCVVLGAYMMSSHLLTLPTPELTDLGPQRAAIAARRSTQHGRWLAVHILDQDCKCSLRVLDHLLETPRPPDVVERIVLLGGAVRPDRLALIHARGFDLDIVTPEQMAERYRVQAAPLLIVIDPADVVSYVGGYTPRKQASDVRDLAVIEALRRGETVAPLPAFGCAVGRGLKEKIDPLGIRNWK
jgi:hypothetical protein